MCACPVYRAKNVQMCLQISLFMFFVHKCLRVFSCLYLLALLTAPAIVFFFFNACVSGTVVAGQL